MTFEKETGCSITRKGKKTYLFSKITLSIAIITVSLFFRNSPSLSEEQPNMADRYAPRDMPVALTLFPRDRYGLLDWAEGVRKGLINPLSSLDGTYGTKEEILDLTVIIKSKRNFMPNVAFPHDTHTYWLSCKICHPGIFAQKSGATKGLSMWKIFKGEFCGRCHDRVAFPIRECYRCHLKRKKKEAAQDTSLTEQARKKEAQKLQPTK